MTRQVFILIISIGLVIFGGIFESRYLRNSCNFVLADIDYTKNALNNNNFEIAKEHIKELENSWNNVKDAWNIFVQNDLIAQIDDSLVELKAYVNNENKEEGMVCANKLRANLEDIVSRQKINFQNVF